MAIATSQQIIKYYERYKAIEVTFTKEVIKATGLVTQQVYLKCLGETWPCVVYASSFLGAKVIVNARSGLHEKIQQANQLVSLRYAFKESDKIDPFMFFVSARSGGSAPYGGSQDVSMLNIVFTQRPPDDLIEIMGRLLDANINSKKRQEERIVVSAEAMRKIGIAAKETSVVMENIPRRCILRDISFSGAKVIMAGIGKFLTNKDIAIRIDFDEPSETILLKGKTLRTEEVEGRKDLVAVAIHFYEEMVPMNYKMRINDYLSQNRTDNRNDQNASDNSK